MATHFGSKTIYPIQCYDWVFITPLEETNQDAHHNLIFLNTAPVAYVQPPTSTREDFNFQTSTM